MTKKRYQVFVSSTFQDLEEERQEVIHALLELDCIPSGMELFPAADETQWNLIKRVIDDCDYYILILGGRYGSVGPEGLGYTEMEYHYALSIEKPIIAFIHRDPGKILAEKVEKTVEGQKKLSDFRMLVEKKLCKKWDSPQELGSVVSRSLIQLINSKPGIGWVRANELADREATIELLNLRKRVEELQTELAKLSISAPKEAEGLAQGDELHIIHFTFKSKSPFSHVSKLWNSKFSISWNQIFSTIAPLMIAEASETELKVALNNMINHHNDDRLRKSEDLKEHSIGYYEIRQDDFQTIKIQLRALGFIEKSEKTRSVKDTETYWRLSAYGDKIMTKLRAIKSGNVETELKKETLENIYE